MSGTVGRPTSARLQGTEPENVQAHRIMSRGPEGVRGAPDLLRQKSARARLAIRNQRQDECDSGGADGRQGPTEAPQGGTPRETTNRNGHKAMELIRAPPQDRFSIKERHQGSRQTAGTAEKMDSKHQRPAETFDFKDSRKRSNTGKARDSPGGVGELL